MFSFQKYLFLIESLLKTIYNIFHGWLDKCSHSKTILNDFVISNFIAVCHIISRYVKICWDCTNSILWCLVLLWALGHSCELDTHYFVPLFSSLTVNFVMDQIFINFFYFQDEVTVGRIFPLFKYIFPCLKLSTYLIYNVTDAAWLKMF